MTEFLVLMRLLEWIFAGAMTVGSVLAPWALGIAVIVGGGLALILLIAVCVNDTVQQVFAIIFLAPVLIFLAFGLVMGVTYIPWVVGSTILGASS